MGQEQLKKLWLLLLLLSRQLLRKLLLSKLLLNKLLLNKLQQLLQRLKGSRQRGVLLQLLLLLLRLKRQGSNKLLLQLLPKKTLSTPKSAQTLVPLLTQFTTLNTKWRTMRRKLTSQGTRRETATSSPAPTPSLMPLEHW